MKENKRPHSDSGVFLPIMAVLATSMFAVIFLLSTNVILMRRATALFRDRAEQVCRLAAMTDDFNTLGETVRNFRDQANAVFDESNLLSVLASDSFTLSKADLIVPTMASGTRFKLDSTAGGVFTGMRDFSHANVLGAGQGCTVVEGGDCRLQVTAPTGSPKIFPGHVMHANAGAYNTFGCEFEALLKVNNFLGALDTIINTDSEIPLRAVYSYWRPVDGNFGTFKTAHIEDARSNAISYDTLLARAPGLTIAVSTHMQTRATDSRFLFGGAFANFDPVDHVTDPATTTFSYPVNMADATRVLQREYSAPDSVSGLTLETEAISFSGIGVADPSFGGDSISPAYELAVACMNPLVMVRNNFLARLLQLVTRHGYLRSNTELLHISTQHRWYDTTAIPDTGDEDDAPLRFNPPVKLVPLGQDLLIPPSVQGYQLPYVYFHTGGGEDWDNLTDGDPAADAYFGGTDQSEHPINPLEHQAFGRVNPWIDDAKPGRSEPLWREYHALLANQLRLCAHLYQDGQQGVDNPFIGLYDSNFEPPEFSDSANEIFQEASVTAFDQDCVWGTGVSCGTTPGITRDTHPTGDFKGVDAISLVSMLGSTQQCPYTLDASAARFYDSALDNYVSCQKPAAENDLRPDFIALMDYLSGAGAADAVASPGFFEVVDDYALDASGIYDAPFAGSTKSSAANQNTPVVIVLHRAPRAAERDAIAAILADTSASPHDPNGNWGDRRIIVVFMPPNQAELNLLGNVQEAFKTRFDFRADPCNGGCAADQNFRNVLFVLDPSSTNNGQTAAFCTAGSCQAADFRNLWLEATVSGAGSGPTLPQEFGIDALATRVFHRIVLEAQRKY